MDIKGAPASHVRGGRLGRCMGWASVLVFPLFCWAVLEYHNYTDPAARIYFLTQNTLTALFGWLVCYLVFFLLLLLLRWPAAACGALGILSFLIAYANYMKLTLLGERLFPKDVLMVGQAGELISFVNGSLFPKSIPLLLLVLAVWCSWLAFLKLELPLPRPFRWFLAASLAALCVLFCVEPQRTNRALKRFSILIEETNHQNSNYADNGFIGAFAINLQGLRVQPPDGYSDGYAQELLEGYEGRAAEREPFDVILVLSESFWDLREMPGLTFTRDPLTHYDDLLQRENCYSGRLYTNAFGGGTVRPEFEILTGLDTETLPDGSTPYEYVTRPLESYVSNYKAAGYWTVAVHPYIAAFYNRKNAYPYLGFDNFHTLPDLASLRDLPEKSGYVTDEALEDIIETLMDAVDLPTFLFAITMQNHYPFDLMGEGETSVQVSSDRLSEDSLQVVNDYARGLYDADRMLGKLAEYIDGRERPTVLIFFGDHKPALGQTFAPYDESGLFPAEDNNDLEDRKVMYSTPFLIYANRELDPGLFPGNRDNELSTYYLMDAVALSTGFQTTPYMELLMDFYQDFPFYNDRLCMSRTPELLETILARQAVTYDRLLGERYTQEEDRTFPLTERSDR